MQQIQQNPYDLSYDNLIMISSSLLIFIAIIYLVTKLRTPMKKNSKLLTPQRKQTINNIEILHNQRKQNAKRFQFHQQDYQSDDDDKESNINININEYEYEINIPTEVVFSIRKAKQQMFKKFNLERKLQDSLVYYDQKQLKEKYQKKQKEKQRRQESKKTSKINNKQESKKQQIKTKPLGGENIKNSVQEQKDKNIQNKEQQKPLFSSNISSSAQLQPAQVSKKQQNQLQKQQSSSLFPASVQPQMTQKNQQPKPNIPINFPQNGLFGLTSTTKRQQQKVNIPAVQQSKSVQQKQSKQSTVAPPPSVILPVSLPQSSRTQRLSQQSSSLSQQLKNISPHIYLQKIILFSSQQKQQSDKQIKLGNFYNTLSNLRQVYDSGIDSLRSIDTNNNKQVNTLAIKLFQFIFMKIIPSFGTQNGWERLPPRNTNDSTWKRQLNTYIMKINLYRVMGYEKIWLIIFGKILKLLQFTWKRTKIIQTHNDLDLIKNKYFKKQGDDMAIKYITRLDLISYFLFTMTTLDPQLYCQYLIPFGHDRSVYQQIKKHKYTWNYNYFWILVQTILKNPINTYYRPIIYLNILSSIYLQVRSYKKNKSIFVQFDVLAKFLLEKGVEETKKEGRNKNIELMKLASQDEDEENYTFDGEDFFGQIETLAYYFKEKKQQYNGQVSQFQKRCSILEYFKKS